MFLTDPISWEFSEFSFWNDFACRPLDAKAKTVSNRDTPSSEIYCVNYPSELQRCLQLRTDHLLRSGCKIVKGNLYCFFKAIGEGRGRTRWCLKSHLDELLASTDPHKVCKTEFFHSRYFQNNWLKTFQLVNQLTMLDRASITKRQRTNFALKIFEVSINMDPIRIF